MQYNFQSLINVQLILYKKHIYLKFGFLSIITIRSACRWDCSGTLLSITSSCNEGI